MKYKQLKRRILELSHKNGLSHIGSCLCCVDILNDIYAMKKKNDIVVLSSGHAGLALYCVLEKHEGKNAEDLLQRHGVHPSRNIEDGIYVSSGSLGQAITVAVGLAIADPKRTVYCVLSDGEMAEGSVWEAFEYSFNHVPNIKFFINANGYGAYSEISLNRVLARICPYTNFLRDESMIKVVSTKHELPMLQGLQAHYKVLSDQEYQLAVDLIK